jgi:hypothetical protein
MNNVFVVVKYWDGCLAMSVSCVLQFLFLKLMFCPAYELYNVAFYLHCYQTPALLIIGKLWSTAETWNKPNGLKLLFSLGQTFEVTDIDPFCRQCTDTSRTA